MSRFTPVTPTELTTEWHECKNAPAKGRGPRGWKTWNLRRIRDDLQAVRRLEIVEKYPSLAGQFLPRWAEDQP